jgi:hypothetical protein
MKDQLIPFDSYLHEQLFAMFILKTCNNDLYITFEHDIEVSPDQNIYVCENIYKLLWEDRSIANVEYEAYIGDNSKFFLINSKRAGYFSFSKTPLSGHKNKIKFHFVEEE